MMKYLNSVAMGLLSLTCIAASSPKTKKKSLGAHEHSVMRVDIAVEDKTIAVRIDGIIEYVTKVKTEKDGDARDAAFAKKIETNALSMFKFSDALGCKDAKADVKLKPEGEEEDHHHGHEHGHKEHSNHRDLEASLNFTCNETPAGSDVSIDLATDLSEIKKISSAIVQLVSKAKAEKKTLNKFPDVVKL